MDMPRSGVRPVEFDTFSTPKHLEHAAEQAHKRNYQDFLIVDVDSHHYENESYAEVFEYIENPIMRRDAIDSGGRSTGFLNTRSAARAWPGASSATRATASTSRAPPSTATSA